MLLSDLILDKRGSLAKVWLSAHHERKLSKQQALGVDVGESVDAILTESRPMALRVSGQLMLGVVRIYGRKVQYLMDDCRETRERISMTFRPGAVDLPQDQVRASRGAITFEAPGFDALDMFDWGTFDVPVAENRGLHTAPLTQTNLRGREYGAFNFGRPKAASIYGDDSRAGSVDDSTQHLDSQDFQPIDLDLGLDDFSMEIGRDARSERSRSKSVLRTPSVINEEMEVDQPFDAGDTFEPLDLGLDFGDLPELEPETEPVEPAPGVQAEERARRSSSELSTPPPETLDLTPRVAKRLADAKAGPRAKRVRIVRADEELELPDDEFAPPADDSPILGEENFIPANPAALRLRDILDDPVAHFLPTIGARLFAGPPGLAPELAELFTFPANVLRRAREEPVTPPRPAKRARKEAEAEASPAVEEEAQPAEEQAEDDVEVARRDSRQPSVHGGDAFDSFEPMLDLDMGDIPDLERRSTREPSIALPRADSAPLADGTHPLAAFDTRTFSSQQTQSDTESEGAGGFSRNTALAMGVLRRELDAIEAEDKRVSFTKLAQGASKRAASAMFFELLVLGTRDAVVLKQDKAFGAIDVAPKERLYALAA